MNQPIFVCLGRAGDCINILPVLKRMADEGQRAAVMTLSPFHEVFEGVSYVDTLISPSNDIAAAVEAAKKLSTDVRCLHVAVTNEETEKGEFKNIQTDSWCKEAYRLAGHYDWWKENLPLVFDQRDKVREDALCPDFLHERKPTILVATGGVSSPFTKKKILMTALKLRFKSGWKILDIGKLKAHRLYDLVGLMEKARFLVTTDSAPLHLARAVPTLPVCAITNDKPMLWNGTAWRPEHLWSCRYSDFTDRWPSMIEAMDNLYQGNAAYNPCAKRDGISLVHVFSAYEGVSPEAKASWRKAYESGRNWIHTPVWFGMFGRDSRFSPVKDSARFPFVKDVIRAGTARCKRSDDQIVLTRSDTCFRTDNGLPTPDFPIFSHRAIQESGDFTHHPAVDLFSFTRQWWSEHHAEYPDFVMGRDFFWQRALRELILKHGGQEVPWLTYQAKGEK